MSLGSRLISNASYLFLDWFVSSVLSFIFWLIIWKSLDPVDWGIIATSTNFVILLSAFVLFGVPTAMSKLIPHFVNRKKLKSAYSLIKFSLKLVSLSVFSFAIIFFFFSDSISTFLKLPKDAFVLTTLSIVFISFATFFGFILYGFQEMKKYFATDSVNFIIKAVEKR